jgi:hypothetical protein
MKVTIISLNTDRQYEGTIEGLVDYVNNHHSNRADDYEIISPYSDKFKMNFANFLYYCGYTFKLGKVISPKK